MTAGDNDNVKQRIRTRPFQSDGDYWRVRNLLIETYPITPTGFNWEIRRWDGWRYYKEGPSWNPRWEELVHLWFADDDKLVGAVHPEGGGDAHLELHPYYRDIEEDMVAWAEVHLAVPADEGRRLSIFLYSNTIRRAAVCWRSAVTLKLLSGASRADCGSVTGHSLDQSWLRVTLCVRPVPTMAITKG